MAATILVAVAFALLIIVQFVAFVPVMAVINMIQARMMGLWVVVAVRRYDTLDRVIQEIGVLISLLAALIWVVSALAPTLCNAADSFVTAARDQMDAYEAMIVGKIGFLPRDLLPLMPGTCTRVKDGDTFVLDDLYTIRMDGINAPEMDTPEGPPSKEYLEGLILGRQVDVHIDLEDRMDHYNRVIGVVYLDKRNICDEMVDAGHAETFLYELPPLEPREVWPIGPRP